MVAIAAPRAEGRLIVRKGRQLGYAEFGPPDGRPVIWFHGTPGGRRQVPHAARVAAHRLNARIIGIERPGTGWSTPHLYDSIIDLTSDLELALDQLDIDRFSVVGLSGGGPYTLATARAMGDRVVSVGVLGGVAPTRGDEASEGGPIALAVRLAPILPWLREPLGALLGTMARTLRPVASAGFDLYARMSPEGDRRVFEQPEIKAMFLDDLIGSSKDGLRAPVYDIILFTRPWGFSVTEISNPVYWWHGDADNIVPLEHAHKLTPMIPTCKLVIRPGESHLGGLGAAEEVLETVLSEWDKPATKSRKRK